MKKKQRLNRKAFTPIIIFLFIFVSILFFLTKNFNKYNKFINNLNPYATPTRYISQIVLKEMENDNFYLPSTVSSEVNDILKKTYLEIDKNKTKTNTVGPIKILMYGDVIWKNQENQLIIDDRSPLVEWSIFPKFLGLDESSVFDDQTIKKTRYFIDSTTSLIEKLFEKNGYTQSISQTSSYIYDEKLIVYQKDKIKCEISSAEGIGEFRLKIQCSDKYEEKYNEQKVFLNDLNIVDDTVRLSDSKFHGKYSYIILHHGAIIAMLDSNNKWNNIFDGDYPPCNLVFKNKIPKDIIKGCLKIPLDEYSYIENPIE